jgi:hypothetical protein
MLRLRHTSVLRTRCTVKGSFADSNYGIDLIIFIIVCTGGLKLLRVTGDKFGSWTSNPNEIKRDGISILYLCYIANAIYVRPTINSVIPDRYAPKTIAT